jgi:uncharacterized protein YwgA
MASAKQLLDVISKLNVNCGAPGKKMAQKIFYLIERSGVELNLEYKIHFYGPYSSNLDYALHSLQAQALIEINTSAYTHTICPINTSETIDGDGFSEDDLRRVDFVINTFGHRTPLELEVLTTTDFVANKLKNQGVANDTNILQGVKKIKGTKFSDDEITQSIKALKKYRYINS